MRDGDFVEGLQRPNGQVLLLFGIAALTQFVPDWPVAGEMSRNYGYTSLGVGVMLLLSRYVTAAGHRRRFSAAAKVVLLTCVIVIAGRNVGLDECPHARYVMVGPMPLAYTGK